MLELYANVGEEVTCERGHIIGHLERDLFRGQVAVGDEVIGVHVAAFEYWPACWCGAHYTASTKDSSRGYFHFSDGWRR